MTYVILWQFEVPPANRAAFETAYGPDGPWAALFRQAEGFLEVRLLRSAEGTYLTLDRWTSQQAFETFKRVFVADYNALDIELEGVATSEQRLGTFEDVP